MMDRDEIMHLVNETAPRYESWGCEAHFQLFAQRLIEREREACAKLVFNSPPSDEYESPLQAVYDAIRARGIKNEN